MVRRVLWLLRDLGGCCAAWRGVLLLLLIGWRRILLLLRRRRVVLRWGGLGRRWVVSAGGRGIVLLLSLCLAQLAQAMVGAAGGERQKADMRWARAGAANIPGGGTP